MALDLNADNRHDDVSEQFVALQKRLSAPNRRLRHELELARQEESDPIFTAHGVREGEWHSYFLHLIPALVLGAVFGYFLAYAPAFGHTASSSDVMTLNLPRVNPIRFSWAIYAKTTLVAAVAYSYIACSRRTLRRRGWLITAVPMIAVLCALYVRFF